MKVDQEFIKARVRITLSELTDYHMSYESFIDLLQEKVEEKLDKELAFWQVVDYSIVEHEPAAIIMEVEGYEENV